MRYLVIKLQHYKTITSVTKAKNTTALSISSLALSRTAEFRMSGSREATDAQPFPSAEVATDKDFKAVCNRLMESGKADMNRVYLKFMNVCQVFTGAMAADPCDCQLKDFYKCADEEGSDIQNCQSVMDKLFECRKNLKGSNPQKN